MSGLSYTRKISKHWPASDLVQLNETPYVLDL